MRPCVAAPRRRWLAWVRRRPLPPRSPPSPLHVQASGGPSGCKRRRREVLFPRNGGALLRICVSAGSAAGRSFPVNRRQIPHSPGLIYSLRGWIWASGCGGQRQGPWTRRSQAAAAAAQGSKRVCRSRANALHIITAQLPIDHIFSGSYLQIDSTYIADAPVYPGAQVSSAFN